MVMEEELTTAYLVKGETQVQGILVEVTEHSEAFENY